MSLNNEITQQQRYKIAVIGLGYVGLPLAVEFAKKYEVIGFDINEKRIHALKGGHDSTLEVADDLLASILNNNASKETGLLCSNQLNHLEDCNVYIITVPTPVDKYNRPDLTPLYKASETVGKVLNKGNIVVYESTVYPGVTEEECVPAMIIDLYKASIISADSGVEPDVILSILATVCSLSPGFIRSGE